VVVEDSLLGIQAGLAANMRVLAFCPEGGAEPAGALGATPFTHMRELPGLLGI
jgi:beta-phosphoglucomutase-like phosphatase (HAD superfamily)